MDAGRNFGGDEGQAQKGVPHKKTHHKEKKPPPPIRRKVAKGPHKEK